ncbi:MAG: hypothetical protein HY943_16975 [Gammaproteobacteria bacterium]|nr:hypothetical protein [Gammaproteobacteria bacterium]
MDKIIFGDNQFFGINHMSEDKAAEQQMRFRDLKEIIKVIDSAYACGIRGFMFNTHDKVAAICEHFRANPSKYADLRLYPSLPYAHKYANAVAEKGLLATLNEFVISNSSAGEIVSTLFRGGKGVLTRDAVEIMKILVDLELKIFRGLNVQHIFLQNIVTDLLLGAGANWMLAEFAQHIRKKHGVDAAFNSMNMPALVDSLLAAGVDNPIVCSSINKIGYLMSPGRESYEKALAEKPFRPIAMSILASGAVNPAEAIEYVTALPNIQSIVFGASSAGNIGSTCTLIRKFWPDA